jgi:DNA-binding CsgD family transcriptional regulator
MIFDMIMTINTALDNQLETKDIVARDEIDLAGKNVEILPIVEKKFDDSQLSDETKKKSLTQLEEQLLGILKKGPLTRDQLVNKLAIARTTIYDHLKMLILKSMVKKSTMYIEKPSRGRPCILFSVV